MEETDGRTDRQTDRRLAVAVAIGEIAYKRYVTIRYDTIEEINVDSKAEYTA